MRIRNPMSLLREKVGHSKCCNPCKMESSNPALSCRDQRAILVNWISGLPKQQLHFLIEELGVPDTRSRSHQNHHCEPLTDRENEVLLLVANGYSRAEIGNTLKISPNTAASHITNIYRKLDISSVADATKYAIAEGILSL